MMLSSLIDDRGEALQALAVFMQLYKQAVSARERLDASSMDRLQGREELDPLLMIC